MRTFFAVLAAIGFMSLVGCGASSVSVGKQFLNKPAPYAKFTMLDGDLVSLEEIKGKDVVIAFWATWCHRSTPVMEKLNRYALRFKGRNDVVFLAVSVDKAEKLSKVNERAEYLGGFRHAFSGNEAYDEAWQAFQGTDLPYIIVMDKTGRVVDVGDTEEVVLKNIR